MRKIFIRHFYWNSSKTINKNTIDTYLKHNTNSTDRKLVINLTSDAEKIKEGSVLEDFMITDYNKTQRSINKLTNNKKSVLYFWNPKYMGKDFIASRIQYFSEKYPNLKFIGIKINGDNIVITNPSVSGFGSIALGIIQRNGHQIKARNPTVMFTYKIVSREFVVHTGIAPMKFDVDVGHRGGQMRIFGVCNK